MEIQKLMEEVRERKGRRSRKREEEKEGGR